LAGDQAQENIENYKKEIVKLQEEIKAIDEENEAIRFKTIIGLCYGRTYFPFASRKIWLDNLPGLVGVLSYAECKSISSEERRDLFELLFVGGIADNRFLKEVWLEPPSPDFAILHAGEKMPQPPSPTMSEEEEQDLLADILGIPNPNDTWPEEVHDRLHLGTLHNILIW